MFFFDEVNVESNVGEITATLIQYQFQSESGYHRAMVSASSFPLPLVYGQ